MLVYIQTMKNNFFLCALMFGYGWDGIIEGKTKNQRWNSN